MKRVPVIQIISGSGARNQPTTIGQPGDRGCVSCGTIYQGEAYTQYGAAVTVIVDARGRYWCLDCAVDALTHVRRRTDERTEYRYPWTFDETGGPNGQHIRAGDPPSRLDELMASLATKPDAVSGDVELSQEFVDAMMSNEDDCTVGAGVPSRSYTREVAAIQAALAHDPPRSAVDILTEKCPSCGGAPCRCLVPEARTPEFSYIRLPGGKATVMCTCGWKDPLGPMPVSPFDPAEALAAAYAGHPRCGKTP